MDYVDMTNNIQYIFPEQWIQSTAFALIQMSTIITFVAMILFAQQENKVNEGEIWV